MCMGGPGIPTGGGPGMLPRLPPIMVGGIGGGMTSLGASANMVWGLSACERGFCFANTLSANCIFIILSCV